jgi:hypothetical protein
MPFLWDFLTRKFLGLYESSRPVTENGNEVRYPRSSAQSGIVTGEYLVDEDAVLFTDGMVDQVWVGGENGRVKEREHDYRKSVGEEKSEAGGKRRVEVERGSGVGNWQVMSESENRDIARSA